MPILNEPAGVLLAPSALFLGALLQILLARILPPRGKGVIAVLCSLPALFASFSLLAVVQSGRSQDIQLLPWNGAFTPVAHLDALSALFALMGTGLGAIVLLYSIGYMAHDRAATRFYTLMLIFIGGFVSLVYCANLFLLYLFWEVIGLCSFSLVGFWYTQPDAVSGARKVLLMTHIAGYGLLAAILILYHRAGTALWTDPAIAHSFSTSVFVLMLVALVAKSVQVPLHTWIPDAMAAPTPVSSLLHAACYVTAGVYLAARMHSFVAWTGAWNLALITIASLTMLVGVMYAMVQADLKRMLAFSTVSQIGYMMLGIGIGTPLAMTAGLLHCLNHGFFKGGLFLNAGAVQHAAGTRDMNELGGLAERMPRTALWWLIGVGNMAGIPLMSGFVSKWMLYAAALQAGWAIPAVIAWVASLGTVFLCVKATSAVFLGPATERTREAHDAPASMQWAMGLMAAGSLVLGVAPQLAVNYVFNPMLAALGYGSAMQVTWLGLFAGAGSFSTTGGLILALISILAGSAVYALAHVGRPATSPMLTVSRGGGALLSGSPGDLFTGGEPISGHARLTAHDFSQIFEQDWQQFFRWSNADTLYRGALQILRRSAESAAVVTQWMEQQALWVLLAATPVLLLGARWLAGHEENTHLAAFHTGSPLLIAACAIAAGGLLIAALMQNEVRRHLAVLLLLCALCVTGIHTSDPWIRMGLLEIGALLSAVVVSQCARAHATKIVYVAVVLISASGFVVAELLMEEGSMGWSHAFLITSACIKFAAVPFFVWLLRLADELPSSLLGLIIAVVDMATFGEMYLLTHTNPDIFLPRGIWFAAAVATALVGALLMLAQRNLKRLLVLSTVEDVGFLFVGLGSVSQIGAAGALAGAATHAVAKALLFICLVAPEEDGALDTPHHALALRYPVSAFGFLVGMLAMLGIPPILGYLGRWQIYESVLQIHPWLLGCLVLSSALALIAYIQALTRTWWGPHDPAPGSIQVNRRLLHPPPREPWPIRGLIVALVLVLLGAGVWPGIWTSLAGGAQ